MLQRVILNPFFQALVVAGFIVLFVPLGLEKYYAEEEQIITHFDQSQFQFADLNHDGISERIHTFFNESGNVGVVIRKIGSPDEQWNFRGIYQPRTARIIIGDYDHSGKDEIYFFTLTGDSLLLHALDFKEVPRLFIKDRFVFTIGKNLKDPDFIIVPGKMSDMNGDGSGDLVFAVNAGFSLTPRNVFIYDILNDSLYISPRSGAFISGLSLQDLDGDGSEEVLLGTYASDNYNEISVPYPDSSSWLMVLDHDLDFLFPPIEFKGITGNALLNTIPLHKGCKLVGEVNYFYSSRPQKILELLDLKGNPLKKREMDSDDPEASVVLFRDNPIGWGTGVTFGFSETEGLFQIDSALNMKKLADVSFGSRQPVMLDIDGDGVDEMISLSTNNKQHFIIRKDLSNTVPIDFPIQATVPLFSIKLNHKGPRQLSVSGDKEWKLYNYGINPAYRLRFLIYLAIYLVFLGFIILIRRLYFFQLKKRYETEKKISALQLSSIKAQMEPHFVFNVINSIGSSIYREKKDEAYQLVVRFSNMVRSMLASSDRLFHTLNDELQFITNYLELEKQRFPELYDYVINVDEAIDRESEVPKMIMQLHVENAIKHGIRPRGSSGLVEIGISSEGDYIRIVITDNGIGRQAASRQVSASTGKGMKILEQLIETYNKYNSLQISQEIIDLKDASGQPGGTRVIIRIPMTLNNEIFDLKKI